MSLCKSSEAEKPYFILSSLNVGGFNSRPAKIAKVFEIVKNFNIFVLQETHFYKESDTLFFRQAFSQNFDIFLSLAQSRCTGVAVLINKNFITRQVDKLIETSRKSFVHKNCF